MIGKGGVKESGKSVISAKLAGVDDDDDDGFNRTTNVLSIKMALSLDYP